MDLSHKDYYYYSSSPLVGHKAATNCFHHSLSLALFCASPKVRWFSASSVVILRRQVVVGLPGFLFPGGVHLRAILAGAMRLHTEDMPQPPHTPALNIVSKASGKDWELLNSTI